ncbi:unnamed protein product [Prorocentrum cordatum]|uniref:Uncharacterized protein n=1 Tax=Prorocentrum cordatum TaxID=2364126 RepID=A0ABN9PJ80_9DINO|nr:unnamed protein product [Polarella glacialis]
MQRTENQRHIGRPERAINDMNTNAWSSANEEAGRPLPPQGPFLAPPWCSTPWKAHAKGKRTSCLVGCYHKRCGENCPRCHDPRCRVLANDILLQAHVVASNYTECPLIAGLRRTERACDGALVEYSDVYTMASTPSDDCRNLVSL